MGAEFYERPYELVSTQIGAMSARADDALSTAQAAIEDLQALSVPAGTGAPVLQLPADPPSNLPPLTEPTAPAGADLTVAGLVIPETDDLQDLAQQLQLTDGEMPVFNPPPITLNIPGAPAPVDTSGQPSLPATFTPPTLPTAPTLTDPELGTLIPIVIPTFAGLTLPTFDAVAPEWTAVAPSTHIAYTEPTYTSTVLDAIKNRISTMLAGGTGLPAPVEQALFDRTRSRQQVEALRAVQDAVDTWAGRGFEMPPGMLVAQADLVRENSELQANATSRDILLQAGTWEIENLRAAVSSGIQLEGVLIGQFMAQAERTFQAAKYRVEADISLYNAEVTVFNALNAAYETRAHVFAEELRGELAKLEELKALISAEELKGTVNEQTVRIYQAREAALVTRIERYKAEISGAALVFEQQKNATDLYRAQIQGWAEKITADSKRFDAYRDEIAGETAKVGLLDASARAFASTVSAVEGKNNIRISNVRAKIEALNAGTQRFVATLGAQRERVSADAEVVRTRLGVFQGQIEKYKVDLEGQNLDKQLAMQKLEARLRNNIAAFEIFVKEYDAGMTRLLQETTLRAEALKTIAATTSQIAAGAFAAMHVSAQLQGDARVSDSYTREDIYRFDGSA